MEGPGQALVDLATLGLGQMVGDVPALVQSASLDQGLVSEDLAHRADEGLGPVDDDQQAAGGRQAALDQADQQVSDDGGVLVSPSHSPTGTLGPSVQIAGAHAQDSANTTPSTMRAATVSSEGSRLMSSSRVALVLATKRRLTDERDGDAASTSTASPTGSLAAQCRRVARPASMRSITRVASRSRRRRRRGCRGDFGPLGGAGPTAVHLHPPPAQHHRQVSGGGPPPQSNESWDNLSSAENAISSISRSVT